MNIRLIIFTVLGGLAMFLYGMGMLSEGLQLAFGDRLRILLERLTSNKLKGVGVGALFTAIIQSSSITTVTLVGLINAGLITLSQSVPVIMGANIGTTITAQLVAFKLGKYALAILAIGFLVYSLGRKSSVKYTGQVMLGFGILFLGMNLMSSEVKLLSQNQEVVDLLARMGQNPLLGIVAGAVFTSIVQSSSATSGLVISMTMGDVALLDLKSAIALILGANIGTCITVVLASIGSSLSAKRAAAAHVLMKIIGVTIFIPLLNIFSETMALTSRELPRQIANAHMFFNIADTMILLPLSGVVVAAVIKILPGTEIRIEKGVKYLDQRTLKTPSVALHLAELETIRMARIARKTIISAREALFHGTETEIQIVRESEAVVDELEVKIENFLHGFDKSTLTNRQKSRLAVLNHAIGDLERISDHANNICELGQSRANRKIQFCSQEVTELEKLFDMALQSIDLCLKVLEMGDENLVRQIFNIENEVDEMVEELEEENIHRLEQGISSAEGGTIFSDVMSNLERITDHTHNIACAKSLGF